MVKCEVGRLQTGLNPLAPDRFQNIMAYRGSFMAEDSSKRKPQTFGEYLFNSPTWNRTPDVEGM